MPDVWLSCCTQFLIGSLGGFFFSWHGRSAIELSTFLIQGDKNCVLESGGLASLSAHICLSADRKGKPMLFYVTFYQPKALLIHPFRVHFVNRLRFLYFSCCCWCCPSHTWCSTSLTTYVGAAVWWLVVNLHVWVAQYRTCLYVYTCISVGLCLFNIYKGLFPSVKVWLMGCLRNWCAFNRALCVGGGGGEGWAVNIKKSANIWVRILMSFS